jgi:hypothetical protein
MDTAASLLDALSMVRFRLLSPDQTPRGSGTRYRPVFRAFLRHRTAAADAGAVDFDAQLHSRSLDQPDQLLLARIAAPDRERLLALPASMRCLGSLVGAGWRYWPRTYRDEGLTQLSFLRLEVRLVLLRVRAYKYLPLTRITIGRNVCTLVQPWRDYMKLVIYGSYNCPIASWPAGGRTTSWSSALPMACGRA